MGGGALRLLLDTHILLWWVDNPARLSIAQSRALDLSREIDEQLGVAAITLWEVAKLDEAIRTTPGVARVVPAVGVEDRVSIG